MQQGSIAGINASVSFPEYLQSFEALQEHFGGYLAEQSTTEKGRRFAHFVKRLISQTDFGSEFELPEQSPKESNDEGVDLTAVGKDGEARLFVQAKLSIHGADAIDSILSFTVAVRSGACQVALVVEASGPRLMTSSPL